MPQSTRSYYFLITLVFIFVIPHKTLQYNEEKRNIRVETYLRGIRKLATLSDISHFTQVLNNILIPRVVGTKNHEKVGDYIKNKMENLNWSVEENIFPAKTPMGVKNFRNIIARLNPDANKYLVLACHYDSKYMGSVEFLGATDSAVPCAMMIHLAEVMSDQLEKARSTDLSLMFIFFDGEEAFLKWDDKDSLYGSKHLANKWHKTYYKGGNELDRIDTLVLLDLLGTESPVFYSYFPKSSGSFSRLVSAEKDLTNLDLLRPHATYFHPHSSSHYVEDDHTPFLQRNVNILHIIPKRFPKVWHTPDDNREALDFQQIDNLNKIMRVFVADYLQLDFTY